MTDVVTVFTPIYNREYIIGQLYQSLLNQTCCDFEWLIIDDGSEDKIDETISQWIYEKKALFPIRFYRQQNGGKHRAINRGAQLAKGDAFFIVDSDDCLTHIAIEKISNWWREIEGDVSFAGIAGLRGYADGKVVGNAPMNIEYVDATNIERSRYNLLGDKAEVYRTSLLREYPFPEFTGENFLTEAVIWDRIANDGYKIRWFNEIIYVCEYREDGLTRQGRGLFRRNPRGWGLYLNQRCRFYRFPSEEMVSQYFIYYIELKDRLTEQKIQEYLNIDDRQFAGIREYHKKCIDCTVKRIGKRIALYGVGDRGKRILRLYRQSGIEICFLLDRERKELPYEQIEIEAEYPRVDAIIVTPKDGQNEIFDFLREKTVDRLIGYDEWRLGVGLHPDF